MIELSLKDLKFKESPEFPGFQIRTNIMDAASALENRKIEQHQDSKLVNLGTIDFLLATQCDSLHPTKTMDEYRKDLVNFLSPYVFQRIVEFEHDQKPDSTVAFWMRQISRKIELSQNDMEFKKSLDAAIKEQIESAAKKLENTTHEQAINVHVWGYCWILCQ